MNEIVNQNQLDNLLRRINRPIHLIAELNSQLEEVFNSSEDLEEEIAFINTKLDILKGIELIVSNQDITIPVYEYFCKTARDILHLEEIRTIQRYIAENE